MKTDCKRASNPNNLHQQIDIYEINIYKNKETNKIYDVKPYYSQAVTNVQKKSLRARISPKEYRLLQRLRDRKPAHNPPKPPESLGDKLTDLVADTVGSWRFIMIQSGLLLLWIILNITAYVQH